jgi:hypothetical protein
METIYWIIVFRVKGVDWAFTYWPDEIRYSSRKQAEDEYLRLKHLFEQYEFAIASIVQTICEEPVIEVEYGPDSCKAIISKEWIPRWSEKFCSSQSPPWPWCGTKNLPHPYGYKKIINKFVNEGGCSFAPESIRTKQ